jgi:endonuclease/exonuclease/phosphatase family metal-dependent hydrolase
MPIATVLLAAGCLAAAPPEPHRILLDGRYDDWRGYPPHVVDPADSPGAPVDIREVRVAHDDRMLHFLLGLGRPVNLQDLRGAIELLIDADADPATGQEVRGMPGVEFVLQFTAEDRTGQGRSRRGLAVVVLGAAPGERTLLGPHAVGLAHAPTYADDRAEIRVERGAALPGGAAFLAGPRFAARWDYLGTGGDLLDATEVFTWEPGALPEAPRVEQTSDPLARLAAAPIRIVSWNVRRGRLMEDPEPFARVLAALDPDVVLIQELLEKTTAPELAALLDERVIKRGGARWNVVIGAGGGDLRCAVASRAGLRNFTAIDPLPLPDAPDRSVRVAAAEVDLPGGKIVAVSVHLTCCGHAGSFEDRTRQVEADAVARALRAAFAQQRPDPLIIGGDLNLVGSRRPLDLLGEGLDTDGRDLAVAQGYQLFGLTDATWADPESPFGPGRLDFVLFSDAALFLERAVPLESRDVAEQWRQRRGLRPDDTEKASDHLPLVVDLRRKGSRR